MMLYTLPKRTSAPRTPTDLVQSLNDEVAAMGGLVELLGMEQQALVQGEADRLEPITRQKTSAMELVSDLGAQRERHLAAHGYGQGPSALGQWCKHNPQQAEAVRQAWQNLLEHALSAQELNAQNGALIETRMRSNRARLDALLCAVPAGNLYRPDGQLRRIDSISMSQRVESGGI